MEPRSLYIHPWPLTGDDRELVVAAKQKLDFDFLVVPQRAFGQDAEGPLRLTPDMSTRVLCIREESPFLCDHAYVPDPANEEALLAAIEWVLTPGLIDIRASTVDSMLAKMGIKPVDPLKERYRNLSKNLGLNHSSKVPIFQSLEEEVDTGE